MSPTAQDLQQFTSPITAPLLNNFSPTLWIGRAGDLTDVLQQELPFYDSKDPNNFVYRSLMGNEGVFNVNDKIRDWSQEHPYVSLFGNLAADAATAIGARPVYSKFANPLTTDPNNFGIQSKIFRNNRIGRAIANSKWLKPPTPEEMGIQQAVEEARNTQYSSDIAQNVYTNYNYYHTPVVQFLRNIGDGNIAHANPWNNTTHFKQLDIVFPWRRKAYKRHLLGIARHEGAHLTQPWDTEPNNLQMASAASIGGDYYVPNPRAQQRALHLLNKNKNGLFKRDAWSRSPKEVMSEIANLGQHGYLEPNGYPTQQGMRFLADRFNLPVKDMEKVVDALQKHHGNFYIGATQKPIMNLLNSDLTKFTAGLGGGTVLGLNGEWALLDYMSEMENRAKLKSRRRKKIKQVAKQINSGE